MYGVSQFVTRHLSYSLVTSCSLSFHEQQSTNLIHNRRQKELPGEVLRITICIIWIGLPAVSLSVMVQILITVIVAIPGGRLPKDRIGDELDVGPLAPGAASAPASETAQAAGTGYIPSAAVRKIMELSS